MDIEGVLRIIRRGVVEIITEQELRKKLKKSEQTERPLTIKAGFDPTAPDLHMGHIVLIKKLKDFQELGHQVVFLIGDFTGMIGDPSGRSETRKPLSQEEVEANAETYRQQIFKILDPKKTTIVFNSQWMRKMSAANLIELSSKYTVARMLERDDFHKRFIERRAISIHEFLYPLIQGYDSVELKADVEIGGTDQKFNLLLGRDLQREYGLEPQIVITTPLLEGLNGKTKMSKSLNNYIGIDEAPQEMFGKIMSISDDLMMRYYELLSELSIREVESLRRRLVQGKEHPREAKRRLAMELVSRFHGHKEAERAANEFDAVFRDKKFPKKIEEVTLCWDKEAAWLPKLLTQAELCTSTSGARRMIEQGGVEVNGNRVTGVDLELATGFTYLIKVGKRRFKKIHLLKKS
ncbi:MAG TPA: tyrosine--tRNA ligase [Syntrophaceae bacterium]|nr:tyrosine--tRNA ligase [Syntrophaceae bacterium]